MKRAFLFFLLFTISACASLTAQTFSLIRGREAITSLDGLWRFHTGDNPAWADPNFDDSQWALLRAGESWDTQGYPAYRGYAWYRCRLEVQDGSRPTDLLLMEILTGYQLYANGKLIGGEGSIVPTRNVVASLPKIYRLPAGNAGPQFIQIAIRVWQGELFGGGMQPGSVAGEPLVLARELNRDQDAQTVYIVNLYAYCLLASLVGLTTLVLFFSRPEDREYFWFSVMLLVDGALAALEILVHFVSTPITTRFAVSATAEGASAIAALFFFSIVLRTHRSLLWWLACTGAAIYPLGLLFYYFGWMSWGAGHAFAVTVMLPADVWFVSTLAVSTVRKGVSARWLLAPAVLYYGLRFLGHLSMASTQLGWQKTAVSFDLELISRPFPLSLGDIFGYVFVLSLLIFLVRRFSAVRQEKARLSQEIEAARSVQSILIPDVLPLSPGFAVENVYLPAQEVGGDFFQIIPDQHDGSLLIVAGDVTGKGLQAGMLVAMLVGAIRTESAHTSNPVQILAALNSRLHGRENALATCLAVRIAADGHAILANAGHLPPYLNGDPIGMEGALPLGMIDTAQSSVTEFQLQQNDRLVLVSDGIIEATNSSGALFGFERLQSLLRTAKSATEVASAAQSFGQEDDISVIAVTLKGAVVPALV